MKGDKGAIQNSKLEFRLDNGRVVQLYESPVYKENVISFKISENKSFILNNESWTFFVDLFPIINQFFKNHV